MSADPRQILGRLGLDKHAPAFAAGEIDAECLASATAMSMWLQAMFQQGDGRGIVARDEACALALGFADETGDRYLAMLDHYSMALDLAYAGHMDQAQHWATRSIETGRESG